MAMKDTFIKFLRPMLGLYLLLAGGMLCLSFVFYALGIRPGALSL